MNQNDLHNDLDSAEAYLQQLLNYPGLPGGDFNAWLQNQLNAPAPASAGLSNHSQAPAADAYSQNYPGQNHMNSYPSTSGIPPERLLYSANHTSRSHSYHLTSSPLDHPTSMHPARLHPTPLHDISLNQSIHLPVAPAPVAHLHSENLPIPMPRRHLLDFGNVQAELGQGLPPVGFGLSTVNASANIDIGTSLRDEGFALANQLVSNVHPLMPPIFPSVNPQVVEQQNLLKGQTHYNFSATSTSFGSMGYPTNNIVSQPEENIASGSRLLGDGEENSQISWSDYTSPTPSTSYSTPESAIENIAYQESNACGSDQQNSPANWSQYSSPNTSASYGTPAAETENIASGSGQHISLATWSQYSYPTPSNSFDTMGAETENIIYQQENVASGSGLIRTIPCPPKAARATPYNTTSRRQSKKTSQCVQVEDHHTHTHAAPTVEIHSESAYPPTWLSLSEFHQTNPAAPIQCRILLGSGSFGRCDAEGQPLDTLTLTPCMQTFTSTTSYTDHIANDHGLRTNKSPTSRACLCAWDGCAKRQGKEGDYGRHVLAAHAGVRWVCPERGCRCSYTRPDALGTHIMKLHKINSSAVMKSLGLGRNTFAVKMRQ